MSDKPFLRITCPTGDPRDAEAWIGDTKLLNIKSVTFGVSREQASALVSEIRVLQKDGSRLDLREYAGIVYEGPVTVTEYRHHPTEPLLIDLSRQEDQS